MSTPGLLICVMGIDGSGKSTATKRVVEQLQHSGVDVGYVWDRWEPRLLAPLMKARGGVAQALPLVARGDDDRFQAAADVQPGNGIAVVGCIVIRLRIGGG